MKKGFNGATLSMGRIVWDYWSRKETTVYGLVHDSKMKRLIWELFRMYGLFTVLSIMMERKRGQRRSDLGGVQLWVHTCWLVGALRCWHPDIVTLVGSMFRESRNFRTMNISLWVICIYSIVELSNSIQTYFNLANTVLYGKNFLNSTWLSKCIHWEKVVGLIHSWGLAAWIRYNSKRGQRIESITESVLKYR